MFEDNICTFLCNMCSIFCINDCNKIQVSYITIVIRAIFTETLLTLKLNAHVKIYPDKTELYLPPAYDEGMAPIPDLRQLGPLSMDFTQLHFGYKSYLCSSVL